MDDQMCSRCKRPRPTGFAPCPECMAGAELRMTPPPPTLAEACAVIEALSSRLSRTKWIAARKRGQEFLARVKGGPT